MTFVTHARLRDIRSDASGTGVHAFTTLPGCCLAVAVPSAVVEEKDMGAGPPVVAWQQRRSAPRM
jgi:hypothetical protein